MSFIQNSTNAFQKITGVSASLPPSNCFFCNDFVPSDDKKQQNIDCEKLAKMLRIAGRHLLQKNIELPQVCDPKVVRVCSSCLETVSDICGDHDLMMEVKKSINYSVSKMQKAIFKTWIMTEGRVAEKNDWTKLFDLSLESYRNKVILMRQINKNNALGRGDHVPVQPEFYSHNVLVRDSEIEPELKAQRIDDINNSTIGSGVSATSRPKSPYSIEVVNLDDEKPSENSKKGMVEALNNHDDKIVSFGMKSETTDALTSIPSDITKNIAGPSSSLSPMLTKLPNTKLGNKSEGFTQVVTYAFANPINYYQRRCRIYICPTCERPVRGNLTKLKTHMFTHKNDKERKTAVAAKEPGCTIHLRKNLGFGRNIKEFTLLECQFCSRKFVKSDVFQKHLIEHKQKRSSKTSVKNKIDSDVEELLMMHE